MRTVLDDPADCHRRRRGAQTLGAGTPAVPAQRRRFGGFGFRAKKHARRLPNFGVHRPVRGIGGRSPRTRQLVLIYHKPDAARLQARG